MQISDIIGIIAVALAVGGAVAYIIKAKKKGGGCIGCPDSKNCSGNCTACHLHSKKPEEK